MIRDVKVVKIECITQHRLLICVFDLKERVEQCKVKPVKTVQGLETETGRDKNHLQRESASKSCSDER